MPSPSGRSDAASTLASPTHTAVNDFSDAGDSRPTSRTSFLKGKLHRNRRPAKSVDASSEGGHDGDGHNDDADKEDSETRPTQVDLEQEANIDPAPFAFKPAQLAQLLDPKNIEALEAMGGVEGLLKGLGTHASLGLGAGKGKAAATHEAQSDDGQGAGRSSTAKDAGAEDVPGITITTPGGEQEGPKDGWGAESPSGTPPNSTSTAEGAVKSNPKAFEAGIEERRRVYGANLLPERKSKSLLMLMWLAMKDKVLVSFFVVSGRVYACLRRIYPPFGAYILLSAAFIRLAGAYMQILHIYLSFSTHGLTFSAYIFLFFAHIFAFLNTYLPLTHICVF